MLTMQCTHLQDKKGCFHSFFCLSLCIFFCDEEYLCIIKTDLFFADKIPVILYIHVSPK